MRLYILVSLLVVGIISACAIETTEQEADITKDNSVSLTMLGNEKVNFDGDVISIANLSDHFKNWDDIENSIIQFNVSEDVTMGEVTDVQEVLRDQGALKINYKSIN